MAGKGDEEEGMIAGINVTPLVDICLVLVIIFMVTAKLIVNPQLGVELPRASSGERPPEGPLSIVVTRDGALLADGVPVSDEALGGLVKVRRAQKPELNALISADLATQHGRVVRVMDLLRREGVTRFGIAVTEEELRAK